jgi:hypothetical protein
MVLFLIAAFIAGAASAGERDKYPPFAIIVGTVFGPDARGIYGVKVKIRRAGEKKAKWELYSNHTGEFAQRVPVGPGDYVVWADVKGFKLPDGKHPDPGPEVNVHISGDERTDIGLHINW